MAETKITDFDDRLWACHPCEMIGDHAQAHKHKLSTGHKIECLSEEMSEAVKDARAKLSAERAANLITYAKGPQTHSRG